MPLGLLPIPSPDWNCQWGPYPRGGLGPSLCPRHVRASMLPQKRDMQSTRTMHFKWHHRNLGLSNQSECDSAVYCSLHRTQGCHLVFFDFFKYQKCPKIPIFSSNHGTWSVQVFLPGPWRFSWGPAHVGPTLVTGPITALFCAPLVLTMLLPAAPS